MLSCLGLLSDAPDPAQLLAWLESRSGDRFGIVLAHTDRLMGGPADDQAGMLDLIDRMLQVGGGGGGLCSRGADPPNANQTIGSHPSSLAPIFSCRQPPTADYQPLQPPTGASPQASSKLQIVLVSDDHLQRTAYNARTLELQPLAPEVVCANLRAARPDVTEVGGRGVGRGVEGGRLVCLLDCLLAVLAVLVTSLYP
jgi:hypothetical protein